METRYTSDSQDMANIGRDYHSHLQSICQSVSEKDQNDKIRAAVELIKTEVTHEQARILGQLLSRDDVQQALKLSANNKTPGLNGIPYEVYKIIDA